MSRCTWCGRENHNGNDVCGICEEEYYMRKAEEEWIEQQREEEEYQRMIEEEKEKEEAQKKNVCKTCGGNGSVYWNYDDPNTEVTMHVHAPCPDCDTLKKEGGE